MMDHGGFSLSNLLQGSSLALIALYVLVLLGIVGTSFAFRGSVVV